MMPVRSLSRDPVRLALAAVLVIGMLVVGQFPAGADPEPTGAVAAAGDGAPVMVKIKGSHMMSPLLAAWSEQLSQPGSLVRVDYVDSNAVGGRQSLLKGDVDAALSALPFTADEEQVIEELRAGGANPKFVTVPMNASALAFSELAPKNALHPATSLTPVSDVPPSPSDGYTLYEALQFYIERPTLDDPTYAALHGYHLYDPGPDPDNPLPPKPDDKAPADFARIEIPARTGPTAMGWMMERMMKEQSASWKLLHPAEPTSLWDRYTTRAKRDPATLSELIEIPFSFNGTEANRWATKFYEPMMDAILDFATKEARPCCFFAGLPPWVLQAYRYKALDILKLDRTDPTNLLKWELRPLAIGTRRDATTGKVIDSVTPTPENIAKALSDNEGLSSPSSATPDTHGGYPASFVNKMIVRTDKMTPTVANGVSDFIVYAVTSGQLKATQLGDATLPAFHVRRALAAASEIVTSVCPPERVVDGAVVLVPNTAERVVIRRCGPAPLPTTTTTPPPPTTSAGVIDDDEDPYTTTPRTPSGVVIAAVTARPSPVTPSVTVPDPSPTNSPTSTSAPAGGAGASGAGSRSVYDLGAVPPPTPRRSQALQTLLGAAAFAVGTGQGRRRGTSELVSEGPQSAA